MLGDRGSARSEDGVWAAGVDGEPIPHHPLQERRHRYGEVGLNLGVVLLFLADEHRLRLEVEVGHERPADLASPRPGVGGEDEHRVGVRESFAVPDEFENFIDLGQGEEYAVPERGPLVLR